MYHPIPSDVSVVCEGRQEVTGGGWGHGGAGLNHGRNGKPVRVVSKMTKKSLKGFLVEN